MAHRRTLSIYLGQHSLVRLADEARATAAADKTPLVELELGLVRVRVRVGVRVGA